MIKTSLGRIAQTDFAVQKLTALITFKIKYVEPCPSNKGDNKVLMEEDGNMWEQ